MSDFAIAALGVASPTVNYISSKVAVVPLAQGVDTGGGVFAWQNPEASAIAITGIEIDVKVVASGACSLDIGATDADTSTTKTDTLIDGLDVHSATGLFNKDDQAGANGKSKAHLASGHWVTGSTDTGASAGLSGFAYIHYISLS